MKKVLLSLLILCMIFTSSITCAESLKVLSEVFDFLEENNAILKENNVIIYSQEHVSYLLPEEGETETIYTSTPFEGATNTFYQNDDRIISYIITIDTTISYAQENWRHCAQALLIAGCDYSPDDADYIISLLYDNLSYVNNEYNSCQIEVDDYIIRLTTSDTTLGLGVFLE